MFHPDKVGDKSFFKIETEATFRTCVERQCHEGVMIESSKDKVDVLLNSKSEWHGRSVPTTLIPPIPVNPLVTAE